MIANGRAYSNWPIGGSPKIAWLGDSITHGKSANYPYTGDTYTGGWRAYVYAALVALGFAPTFYGDQVDTADGLSAGLAGNYHSGHDGVSAQNWLDTIFGTASTIINGQGTPNIVGIALGTNGNNSVAEAQRVGQVADLAIAAWPKANIILLTRAEVLNPSTGAVVAPVNLINPQLFEESRLRRGLGRHIQTVGVETPPILSYIGGDGIHATAIGYRWMADRITNAIVGLAR